MMNASWPEKITGIELWEKTKQLPVFSDKKKMMAIERNERASLQVLTDSGNGYSELVGFLFVFNLIVGTGALTMPAAFREAGWVLSLIVVIVLAFMSYLTLTFMIEAMAISNAKIRFQELVSTGFVRKNSLDASLNTDDERQPLVYRRKMSCEYVQ
ncbi:hypothetical protein Btru_070794 [Bulinus truncatus]|nr:hypothetical protein Btru_070794 [Bulinus truncatus]